MKNDPTQQNWLSQEDDLQYVIASSNMFEEYKTLKDLAFNSERLSSFLDKQDSISKKIETPTNPDII